MEVVGAEDFGQDGLGGQGGGMVVILHRRIAHDGVADPGWQGGHFVSGVGKQSRRMSR